MSNTNADEQAFPSAGTATTFAHRGMTLRDYFAAKAMAQLVHNRTPWDAAEEAYQYADALLSARGTEKARQA